MSAFVFWKITVREKEVAEMWGYLCLVLTFSTVISNENIIRKYTLYIYAGASRNHSSLTISFLSRLLHCLEIKASICR